MPDSLREQITQAVGEYSGTVMRDNPNWVFALEPALKLVEQIIAIVKEEKNGQATSTSPTSQG